jgi:hypothetical protein
MAGGLVPFPELTACVIYVPYDADNGEEVYFAIDDVTFDGFNPVPIPASILLLGTGLLPLVRLRKKS